ncbi:helix-turn-helix transcriptional regulator [bacterium]|nr:helix-turn-helix transcriptional regulator [bacterium]
MLGKNIQTLRKSKDLSQEELAFRVGTARNYLGCVERAEKFPSLAFIFDIKDALNCKIEDLFININ